MRHGWNMLSHRFSQRVWFSLGGLVLVLVLLAGCTGGAARQESWPGLVVANGTLYVADVGQVQSFEAETGRLLWSFPEKADPKIGFYATPTLDEERGQLLVAGFKDQKIYALRLEASPEEAPYLVWTFPGPQAEEGAKGQYVASGVIAGDLFLIGNGDGVLYALNLADGTLAWSFPTGDRIWATPLVVEDTVYAASLDRHLYALNLADGTERWVSVETRGALATSPVLVDGALWIGDFGDHIYQVDPQTGEILWTFEDGEDWFWAMPVVNGDQLYFSDVRGNVYAFDATSHELLWKTHFDDVLRGRGVLSPAGDVLYLPGDKRGLIYALDTANGDKLPWGEVPLNPGRLPGDLVVDGERLYAMPVMATEHLKVFDIANGKLLWQYPLAEGGE